MGNRNESVDQAAVSVVRFGISLFDLGRYTRAAWPGRGGWGSTFGLPLIWAFAVLARYRRRPEVRRSLWIAVVYMVVFAAIYTDADIAHRLLLGPGLLLILVAVFGQRRRGPAVASVTGRPVRGDHAVSVADRAQRHAVSRVLAAWAIPF